MLLNPGVTKSKTKRRPLTAEEKAEGQRLKRAIKRAKLSQEEFALEMGWKGQSAVSQYVNHVPMSDAVIIRMTNRLGIQPTEIRPDVWDRLEARPPGNLDSDAMDFAGSYADLDDDERDLLRNHLDLIRRLRGEKHR